MSGYVECDMLYVYLGPEYGTCLGMLNVTCCVLVAGPEYGTCLNMLNMTWCMFVAGPEYGT